MKRESLVVGILLMNLIVGLGNLISLCQFTPGIDGGTQGPPCVPSNLSIDPASTEVSDALSMDASINSSTPVPLSTIRGQPFNITFNVDNPNAVTVIGYIFFNITNLEGITIEDVDVRPVENCLLRYAGNSDSYTNTYGLCGTLGYFSFTSGLNKNVASIQIWYNKVGNYTLSVWASQ